jgi:hypothetical protein
MFSRFQSAGLLALAATVSSCSLYFVASHVPYRWGNPILSFMEVSTLFLTFAVFLFERAFDLSRSPNALIILAPYPFYGAMVGYNWPVASGSIGIIARSVLRRVLGIFAALFVACLCLVGVIMIIAGHV